MKLSFGPGEQRELAVGELADLPERARSYPDIVNQVRSEEE